MKLLFFQGCSKKLSQPAGRREGCVELGLMGLSGAHKLIFFLTKANIDLCLRCRSNLRHLLPFVPTKDASFCLVFCAVYSV